MLTPKQIVGLHDRLIDVGIAGANAGIIDDPLIAGVRIAEDTIECALMAEAHPLASRNWLTPADLADVPFMFIDRSTYPKFHDIVMEHFAVIGLKPRMSGAYNGPRALWRAAADSDGWTLGARSMRERPLAGMVAVPIQGLHIPSGLQLIWRRGEDDPAVLAVLEAFRRLPSAEVQTMGGVKPI
jgi:DNA-binding transcriptional LysR family regulator